MNLFKLALVPFGFAVVAFHAAPASATEVLGTGTLQVVGKCVDDPGSSVTNGTIIQIYDCNGGMNQNWDLLEDGTIRPEFDTNKCLDLPSGQTDNGTHIQLYDCNGGPNQQWILDSSGTLTGVGDKCVDDPSGATDNGTQLQYYDCNGGPNQSFVFTPLSN